MPTQFGDTPGMLSRHQHGATQFLSGKSTLGTDTIDNVIVGDAATLLGHARGGNDVLAGGSGGAVSNELTGDAETMAGWSRGGNDVLQGGVGSAYGSDHLRGDAITMTDHAHGGRDVLIGGLASSSDLTGDADTMSGHAVGGDDILVGPSGRSGRGFITLSGDAGTMTDHARGGDDLIGAPASGGADGANFYGDAYTLSGHARGGDDTIQGYTNSAANFIYGDGVLLKDQAVGGDDVLVSAPGGNDGMWGDAREHEAGTTTGRDTFVFAPGNGNDAILDFEPGKDVIDLREFAAAGIHGMAGLDIQTGTSFNDWDDVVTGNTIRFDAQNTIFVSGTVPLTAADFLFG